MSPSFSTFVPSQDKTILVLGGSYGGLRAASILSKALPEGSGHRVILVERNSHFNRESSADFGCETIDPEGKEGRKRGRNPVRASNPEIAQHIVIDLPVH